MEIKSTFSQPRLKLNRLSLSRLFSGGGLAAAPDVMRNYHMEEPVSPERISDATPAAVLIPIVDYGDELRLLFTRRHHEISYPEHLCFPGGRRDPSDDSCEENALRETREEIGLTRENIEIIGRLGSYYTQSGFRIEPVVSFVKPPLSLTLAPLEVSEIVEIPLDFAFRSDSYRLWQPNPDRREAFYSLIFDDEIVVTGPTVCLLMGLYESLVRSSSDSTRGREG